MEGKHILKRCVAFDQPRWPPNVKLGGGVRWGVDCDWRRVEPTYVQVLAKAETTLS